MIWYDLGRTSAENTAGPCLCSPLIERSPRRRVKRCVWVSEAVIRCHLRSAAAWKHKSLIVYPFWHCWKEFMLWTPLLPQILSRRFCQFPFYKLRGHYPFPPITHSICINMKTKAEVDHLPKKKTLPSWGTRSGCFLPQSTTWHPERSWYHCSDDCVETGRRWVRWTSAACHVCVGGSGSSGEYTVSTPHFLITNAKWCTLAFSQSLLRLFSTVGNWHKNIIKQKKHLVPTMQILLLSPLTRIYASDHLIYLTNVHPLHNY